jgi:hypothetical protein
MPKFEIYFHGLICFWADQPRDGDRKAPKKKALFIKNDYHLRTVILPGDKRYFDDFETIELLVEGGNDSPNDGGNTRFQEEVPHLGDDRVTTRGYSVKPDYSIQKGAAVSLELPQTGGKLRVAQRYYHEGMYTLDDKTHEHLVARITRYTFKADRLWIAGTVNNSTRVVEVPTTPGWVAILNVSPRPDGQGQVASEATHTSGECNNHFQLYHAILFDNDNNMAKCDDVAKVADDDPFVDQREKGDHISDVKYLPELYRTGVLMQTSCSNSNWP